MEQIPDLVEQILDEYDQAEARVRELQEELIGASKVRGRALAKLSEADLSYRQIGDLVGLSAARVGQLVSEFKMPDDRSLAAQQNTTGWKFVRLLRKPEFRQWLKDKGWTPDGTGNVYPVPLGGSEAEVVASMNYGRHLLVTSDRGSRFGLQVRIVENHPSEAQ